MRKIFTLITVSALWMSANAQTVIQNASLENWTTVNGKLYPDKWDIDSFEIDNGSVQRVTPGSAGTYAMKLGSYNDGGTIYGATVEMFDTVTTKPGSLSFEYKVVNAPGFLNGLFIQLYFYDDVNFLRKFSFSAETNNAAFKTGTMPIGFAAGEVPTYYRLEVNYFNMGTATNEYTIVDNFRFGNSTDVSSQSLMPAISIWPNPATKTLNLSNIDQNQVKEVRFTAMDGRTSVLNIENSTIDISTLSKGIYVIEVLDNNNKMVRREKIVVKD